MVTRGDFPLRRPKRTPVGEFETAATGPRERDQTFAPILDQEIEADATRPRELERIGEAPGVGRIAGRRRRDQGLGAGENGARVRRTRLGAKARRIGVDEPRVDGAALDLALGEQRIEKGEIGLGADDFRLSESRPQRRERPFAARRVGNQLGDQRIVNRRHVIARLDAGVDAQRGRSLEP